MTQAVSTDVSRGSTLFSPRLIALLLVLLVIIVYAQTTTFQFVNLDDSDFVAANPFIQKGLTWESVRWAFTADLTIHSGDIDYWQPITVLSRLVDVDLYGMDPAGHHFTNMILHLANTILLFALLHRASGEAGPSAFAAALFAVHPMHAASVAWVTERKDVLSLFFGLIALLAWISHASGGRRRDYGTALAAFALSLMSKPMTIPLPAVMLILLVWPLRRIDDPFRARAWLRPLRHVAPFLLLSAASLVITVHAQTAELHPIDRALQMENVIVSYVTYLGRAFAPWRLACYIPFPTAPYPRPVLWSSGLALLLGTAGAARYRKSRPYLPAGWMWYLTAMMPAIATTHEATANRFTYLALPGLYIIAAWTVRDLARIGPRARAAVTAGAIAGLAALTAAGTVETSRWHDSFTLFRRALEVTENNDVAHRNLGVAYASDTNYPAAMSEYRAALAINPHDPSIWIDMGQMEDKRGHLAEAEHDYREALRCDPDCLTARSDLGRVLLLTGRPREAAAEYEHVLRVNPDAESARNNYGAALLVLGRTDDALRQFELALPIHPDKAQIHRSIAVCRFLQGDFTEWIAELRATGDLDGRDPEYARLYISDMIRHMLASDTRSRDRSMEAVAWAERTHQDWIAESVRIAVADATARSR